MAIFITEKMYGPIYINTKTSFKYYKYDYTQQNNYYKITIQTLQKYLLDR